MKPKEEAEEVHICSHCKEEVGRVPCGDGDYLIHCHGCHQTEGDTEYVSLEDFMKGLV